MNRRSNVLSHGSELLPGLVPPVEVLKPEPAPPIPKRRQKRLDGITRIHLQREKNNQNIGYLAKPFLLCGLPFKVPKTNYYRRVNGDDIIEITGSPEYGLPFGADILVLVWISTLAILKMKDSKVPRVIEFSRASDMLKALGLPLDGRTYRRMQERFLRIFKATFFYGKRNEARVNMFRAYFFDAVDLWFTPDLDSVLLPGEEFRNNRVVLSEAFATDLETNHPPIELEAVKLWSNKPGQLYFYLWLVYRCYVAVGSSRITLMGPGSVKQQCGAEGYNDPRQGKFDFRSKMKKWLADVKLVWPDCPAELDFQASGDFLIIQSKKTAINEKSRVSRPLKINNLDR